MQGWRVWIHTYMHMHNPRSWDSPSTDSTTVNIKQARPAARLLPTRAHQHQHHNHHHPLPPPPDQAPGPDGGRRGSPGRNGGDDEP